MSDLTAALGKVLDVELTESGCWLWMGATSTGGYGRWRDGSRTHQAHRVVYERLVGPIPAGLVLDHLCRVRRCVNPAHLEPVTNRENLLRGVGFPAENARKTHCAAGHPYSGDNLIVRKRGDRECRACKNDRLREWREANPDRHAEHMRRRDERRRALARPFTKDEQP